MDLYNGIGKYADEYENCEKVDIETLLSNVPEIATVSDDQEAIIVEMLNNEYCQIVENTNVQLNSLHVLSFDEFVEEYKGAPTSNIQSYFGCLDDSDDEEEWTSNNIRPVYQKDINIETVFFYPHIIYIPWECRLSISTKNVHWWFKFHQWPFHHKQPLKSVLHKKSTPLKHTLTLKDLKMDMLIWEMRIIM